MSEFYDEIMASIEETRQAAKEGEINTTFLVRPINRYQSSSIRDIRNSLHMSQAIFAGVIGVSKKTVEAWEAGRNTPTGPASRVLDLMREDPTIVKKFAL